MRGVEWCILVLTVALTLDRVRKLILWKCQINYILNIACAIKIRMLFLLRRACRDC